MKEYTIVINGKPEGPFAIEELNGLNIKPGTFIRKPGMDDYKEAHEISELRELFGFRYQQTAPQYYASFDQRLMASVIDYFIIMFGYVLVVLIAYIFINQQLFRIGTAIFLLILVPITKIIYASIAEASIKQATFGKRLVDIKVGDMLGNRIALSTSFARNVAKILSKLPFFLGYFYSIINKKQQCWHDLLAETVVVKQRLM